MAASFKGKIIDPIGLHARPATLVVTTASKFKCDITVRSQGKKGNLKSIMNVMALGIRQNNDFEIIAEGEDETEAIKALQKTMKDNKLV